MSTKETLQNKTCICIYFWDRKVNKAIWQGIFLYSCCLVAHGILLYVYQFIDTLS